MGRGTERRVERGWIGRLSWGHLIRGESSILHEGTNEPVRNSAPLSSIYIHYIYCSDTMRDQVNSRTKLKQLYVYVVNLYILIYNPMGYLYSQSVDSSWDYII